MSTSRSVRFIFSTSSGCIMLSSFYPRRIYWEQSFSSSSDTWLQSVSTALCTHALLLLLLLVDSTCLNLPHPVDF